MESSVFTPAAIAPNLRETVYEQIKEAIVTGRIPAGARLSEVEMSRQLNVSRTPVREAIRQLAETGLVYLSGRGRIYVLLPTAKDAADLYEIRNALEAISVEHLCERPPRDFLLRQRGMFEEVSNEWAADRFMEMDSEFHSGMSRMADNNYLDFMLGKVGDLIQICRHYAIGSIPKVTSSKEHIAIIDAILSGDVTSALRHMERHMINTRDGLLEYISRHPEASEPVE